MTTAIKKTYETSQLYNYEALDLDDLSYLALILEDFSNAAAGKIESTPAIQMAFNALFEPQKSEKRGLLTEAYMASATEHCMKYAATIEKSFKEFNPDARRNMQKHASIEHILYIDLYAKLLAGETHMSGQNAVLSMPMLNSLVPDDLKTDESIALCRELGAHNIADIATYKAFALH
jgi:hypothetical protein|tara:strand:- start:514 stop:1044 length:531 start_codon:yes stop_codon:yes gene_type:complete